MYIITRKIELIRLNRQLNGTLLCVIMKCYGVCVFRSPTDDNISINKLYFIKIKTKDVMLLGLAPSCLCRILKFCPNNNEKISITEEMD